METDVSQEYQEYLNEYRILQETKSLDEYLDEIEENSSRSCDEGEQEADWLCAAGLPQLSEAFAAGREVPEAELEPALRSLPRHQAEAVKKRVRTLNHTVRRRGRQPRSRPRKPDIRDVFKDYENSSTGTRSRSATPDSLDSELPGEGENEEQTGSPPRLWSYPAPATPTPRNIAAVVERTESQGPRSHPKDVLRRQPSNSLPNNHSMFFRHPGAWGGYKGSLAGDSEGIEVLFYQPIGTIHLPRPRERMRSGSDPVSLTPSEESNGHLHSHYLPNHKSNGHSNGINGISSARSKLQKNQHISITRSHSNLYSIDQKENPSLPRLPPVKSALRRSGSYGQLGFEEICQQTPGNKFPLYQQHGESGILKPSVSTKCAVGRTWVEFLGEDDLLRLRPLLLLEVTALFDSFNISFNKRKTPKRKRKDEGNVFGVPLATLLAKDRQIVSEECHVPLVFQKVLSHLERVGVREEGILRVAGLQQKVEVLHSSLEADFYRQPERVEQMLQAVSCHDLAGLLKRLLRDLPQPLLTVEYIDLFFQCHGLPDKGGIQTRALNLLILLLPPENRHTLRALFSFLLSVVRHQNLNKMSLHNVAMIIAPSLFTPRYVHPADKSDLNAQVALAATCCRLTESMLLEGEKLWVVPEDLVAQIRRQKEEERYRKGHKENSKPMKRLLGKKPGLRDQIMRKIDNEVDFQDGVIRVNAPQFQIVDIPIQLSLDTTAGDVVLRIVEEATRRADVSNNSMKLTRRPHDMKLRALAELAPNGNLSCILATGYPELTLQTHFLYEIGGNIAQRQVEHCANLMAVYKENPNAQWVLRCHHRNANNASPIH